MNTVSPSPARQLTRWSTYGLLLLLPTVVVSWIVVLSTDRGGRCLMYGEHCSPVPGAVVWGFFWTAAGAGVLALVWPRTRWSYARSGAVLVQWGAQLTLSALILSGA
ncbi:hypothetical protein ACIQ6Y_26875 [Streptomyces sp. NPDC096205]|uniref:hypothetical protein n=1 Tax=Streptomyces sp. NPDC096205 TaxID=3366081 RepID=UPI0037FD224B